MTDETTVRVVEAFNPYDAAIGQNYYLNRAWTLGKEHAAKVENGETTEVENPYHAEGDNAEKHKAWQEGYEGTGIGAAAFDHPVPTEGDGIFIMPDITGKTDPISATMRQVPVMVWCYNAQEDSQDPKVKPLWHNFPIHARSIVVADGHAWSAANRWMSNTDIRGYRTYELPCPPYNFEADGNILRISAGFFSKAGTKQEWEQVLEQMTEEVENLPDGVNIEDDYVNVNITITYQQTVSVSATALLSGHDELQDGDTWVGSEDDYHSALEDAVGDYGDWEYEIDTGQFEYPDIDINDLDFDSMTSF